MFVIVSIRIFIQSLATFGSNFFCCWTKIYLQIALGLFCQVFTQERANSLSLEREGWLFRRVLNQKRANSTVSEREG